MEAQQPEPMLNLGRLTALAERLAAEGRMNLNKLVEAAVYAEIRRAGWRYRPQVTAETMAAELDASLPFLAHADLAPELLAALAVGRRMLAERRPADLLSEEAPDAFVCRTCGHTALGSPPKHCPDCGAWPGRFRKFVAMFNGDNQEPINPLAVLARLAQNAADLARLAEGLSEEQLARRPAGVDWAIREHIAHFYDTQEMLDTRVDLMLRCDNPELTALAVFQFATEAECHPASARAILAAFRDRRAKCIARLESAPLKDLWRTGWHPEFGQLTILRQAAYLAYHEQTHLPEIEALRAQVAGAA